MEEFHFQTYAKNLIAMYLIYIITAPFLVESVYQRFDHANCFITTNRVTKYIDQVTQNWVNIMKHHCDSSSKKSRFKCNIESYQPYVRTYTALIIIKRNDIQTSHICNGALKRLLLR